MNRFLALLVAPLLVALPLAASAQAPAEQPPAGAVVVVAYMYDGVGWFEIPGGIAIPPLSCDPA